MSCSAKTWMASGREVKERNTKSRNRNTKHQAPNTKEIANSKLQTAARASSLELGAWRFSGVWCLVF